MPRAPLLYGLLGVVLAFSWQALTVHFNYEGQWSALFHTGGGTALPDQVAAENPYRFRNSAGFDGQYYHLVAHDPLNSAGTGRFADSPRLRWRRILVPGLAHLLAFGSPAWIDGAFWGVIQLCIFAGVSWTSLWCGRHGVHAAWGLLFCLLPATLVSVDRSAIDVALAALCAGFAAHACRTGRWAISLVLVLAPLARETGVVLPVGHAFFWFWKKDWPRGARGLLALVPYVIWLAYLQRMTVPDTTSFASALPFLGLVRRTAHPVQHDVSTSWLWTAASLDYLAVIGMWIAVAVTIRSAWSLLRAAGATSELQALEFMSTLFVFTFVAFLSQPQAWDGAYTFGRTMSPLIIWLALAGTARRSWPHFLPLAFMVPRVLFQLKPQLTGIFRGLLSYDG